LRRLKVRIAASGNDPISENWGVDKDRITGSNIADPGRSSSSEEEEELRNRVKII
jgi:hypothetical protein